MTHARLLNKLAWTLVLAFLLPLPVVQPAIATAWRVTWTHPVLAVLQGHMNAGVFALYVAPLVLAVLLLSVARRRWWLAGLLGLLPWLLFPLAQRTGMSLLVTLGRHTAWWLMAALCLLWIGAGQSPQGARQRIVRYASGAGVLLLVVWLFLPGFNHNLPNTPLVRLPFTLIRSGVGPERILGLGLLLGQVCWLLAAAQCVLQWLGVGMFSLRDRRQTLLLSLLFVGAGVLFAELVTQVMRANDAATAQGWMLVSLLLGRLKTYLTLVPLFLLLPVSWSAWLQAGSSEQNH